MRKTVPEITDEINSSHNKSVSVRTFKTRLLKTGLHGRICMRKIVKKIKDQGFDEWMESILDQLVQVRNIRLMENI